MASQIDLTRQEIAQAIVTIVIAFVAARDLKLGGAAARAVLIIKEAFEVADTLISECRRPPSIET